MIRLNLTATPQWLDLAPGLRLLVAPLTTALMVSARADTIKAVVKGATSRRRPGANSSHCGVAVRFKRIISMPRYR